MPISHLENAEQKGGKKLSTYSSFQEEASLPSYHISLTLSARLHLAGYSWYTEEDSFEETGLLKDVVHHGTFRPDLSEYLSWTEERT